VVHGGGFSTGSPQTNVARDMAATGNFFAIAVEYRLAPPHVEMNTPAGGGQHSFPGQNDESDAGQYHEQTDDLTSAMTFLRGDPRCNGEVVWIGGSAGASHGLYLSARGTPDTTQPDLLVMLSCGISNFADANSWALDCTGQGGTTCPHTVVANYLNITDTFPSLPTGGNLTTAQNSSPIHYVTAGVLPPMDIYWSDHDGMGIPTSTGVNISSSTKSGVLNTPPENGANGLLPKLATTGYVLTSSATPIANSYRTTQVATGGTYAHSFDYWHTVRAQVIAWLSSPIP